MPPAHRADAHCPRKCRACSCTVLGEAQTLPLQDSYPNYWGQIHHNAPCCSSVRFARIETINRGWDHPSLQDDFCAAAMNVSGSTCSGRIDKLILVAHSMGNLIASGALASGRCNMAKNVHWISIAAPMEGTKSSNCIEKVCQNEWMAPLSVAIGSMCPAPPAILSMRHMSTVAEPMKQKFKDAQHAWARHVTRLSCGVDTFGVVGVSSLFNSLRNWWVAMWSFHDHPEVDGLVDFSSCTGGRDWDGFGSHAETSLHYKARVNHMDAAFQNGDGWWGSDRKPMQWFQCTL
ncbi:hypothetical protein DYB35_010450 [Aphanomyces astaci]|uniref:GPI inositol-deacylase n=1 Tax=Aphanomyces astaci TaxID=112090 RepID=A0A3R6WNR7_APHAT|nr:hypothetical protein DYB35_010450 [Aphanomyces astaci]